jgi:hypothetical protein
MLLDHWGYPLPEGSRIGATKDFHNFRIELYDGADGFGYCVLCPKKYNADGKSIRCAWFVGAAMRPAEQHGRRPPGRGTSIWNPPTSSALS